MMVRAVSTLNGGSSATYTYDTDGTRIVKQAGSDTAEYIIANGQILSEHHSSNWNDWSDLVYLNGRLLAKADSYEDRILITGSNPGSGYSLFAFSGGYSGYMMRSGDALFLRQYQTSGSHGGMQIAFTDGTNTNWNATDSDGQEINNDGTQGSWHYRRIDLSSFAGKTISGIYLDQEISTTASPWSIYYTDIALISADGTVRPLYNRQTSVSMSHSGTSTGTASVNHLSGQSQVPDETTTFYHGDHLGSSREMSSVNGYPVWQATYLPFGYEYNPQITVNNFKFTGKERDTESGLDNFGARYNASTMGRFLTPDSARYSGLSDPQSLNLYSYVGNHPTFLIDPDGRCWQWAQKLCDAAHNAGQRFDNLFHGEGFRTDQGVENYAHQHNAERRQQEVNGSTAGRLGQRYGEFHRNWDRWWAAHDCEGAMGGCGLAPSLASLGVYTRPTRTLFRAVSRAEFEDIQKTEKFSASPGGAESKYFYPTLEQAEKMGGRMYGEDYGVVVGNFPESAMEGPFSVATEGDVFTVPNENLELARPAVEVPLEPEIPE